MLIVFVKEYVGLVELFADFGCK